MGLNFDWNVDLLVTDLLADLRLPTIHTIRIYNQLLPKFDELVTAIEAGNSWHLHLVDRTYVSWPGLVGHVYCPELAKFLGQAPPEKPVESVVYDLAELARRKKRSKDATGKQGAREKGGSRGRMD